MDVESAVAKARAAAEAITANSGKSAAKPSSKAKVRHMQLLWLCCTVLQQAATGRVPGTCQLACSH